MAGYISLTDFWNLVKAKRLQSPRVLGRGVQRQSRLKPKPPLPKPAGLNWCHSAGRSSQLCADYRHEGPGTTGCLSRFWYQAVWSHRACAWLSVHRVSYSVRPSGWELKLARRSFCAGEGNDLSLCTWTSVGVPVLSVSKGEDATADNNSSSRC